jgi:hypothetical protein
MCDDGDQYTNCNIAFTCEGSNITNNLKYPFWGENREKYCGGSADSNTELRLTCEGSVPKIIINFVKYRILDWEDTAQKLTVARDDYWNGICATSDNHHNSVVYFGYFKSLILVCLIILSKKYKNIFY